jgi:hypothetical protein
VKAARTPPRKVDLADLGAWLLKGNADRRDLAARFAIDPLVETWGVHPSYRTAMMAAGQPVLFWGSGSRHRLPYGIWGSGEVAGPPAYHPEAGRWLVPLNLVIWDRDEWVPRSELRGDPELAGLEVLRQPQAANPSYVTKAELAALRDYLPPDPTCPR